MRNAAWRNRPVHNYLAIFRVAREYFTNCKNSEVLRTLWIFEFIQLSLKTRLILKKILQHQKDGFEMLSCFLQKIFTDENIAGSPKDGHLDSRVFRDRNSYGI